MTYAFNPHGNTDGFTIVDELQSLNPPAGFQNYVIPFQSPFFIDDVSLKITATSKSDWNPLPLGVETILKLGVDWSPGFVFEEASNRTAKFIYSAIVFTDPLLRGPLKLTYTTLGGTWIKSRAQQLAVFNEQLKDPRSATHEQAYAISDVFPRIDKTFSTIKTTGWSDVVGILGEIADIVRANVVPAGISEFSDHIANRENPHKTNKTQLGLGLVNNWKLATVAEAQAGLSTSLYVSPKGAFAAFNNPSVMPNASVLQRGLILLNPASSAAQADDAAMGLTAAAAIKFKTATFSNTIKTIFSYQRKQYFFNPNPVPFPVICLGRVCKNFGDLIEAVSVATSIKNIQFNPKLGCIYLPNTAPSVNLTCTPV